MEGWGGRGGVLGVNKWLRNPSVTRPLCVFQHLNQSYRRRTCISWLAWGYRAHVIYDILWSQLSLFWGGGPIPFFPNICLHFCSMPAHVNWLYALYDGIDRGSIMASSVDSIFNLPHLLLKKNYLKHLTGPHEGVKGKVTIFGCWGCNIGSKQQMFSGLFVSQNARSCTPLHACVVLRWSPIHCLLCISYAVNVAMQRAVVLRIHKRLLGVGRLSLGRYDVLCECTG